MKDSRPNLAPYYRRKPYPALRVPSRLSEDGSTEVLDPVSLTIAREFQPPTLAMQVTRLTKSGRIHRQFNDDLGEDEWLDAFDEDDRGLSEYEYNAEMEELNKRPKRHEKRAAATSPPASEETPPKQPSIVKEGGSDKGDE